MGDWKKIVGCGKVRTTYCNESWFMPKVTEYFKQKPITEMNIIAARELNNMLVNFKGFNNYYYMIEFVNRLNYLLNIRGEI